MACAVAAAIVIAAAVHPQRGPVAAALSWRPLRGLGIISYGVYLWHWPVYVYLDAERVHLAGWPLLAIRIAVTLAIAFVSFRLLEQPVRAGFGAPQLMRRLVPVVAAMLVVVVVATTNTSAARVRRDWLPDDVPERGSAEWALARDHYAAGARQDPDAQRILVLGDSIATSLAYLDEEGFYRAPGVFGASWGLIACSIVEGEQFTGRGVGEHHPRCDAWPELFGDLVDSVDPDVAVLMLGPWEMFDRRIDGKRVDLGSPELTELLVAQLDRALAVLTRRGARLAMLTTPCYTPERVEVPGAAQVWRDTARTALVNDVWARFAAAHPREVALVDLGGFLCPGGRAREHVDGERVRSDGLHFTAAGARVVWSWLASQLVATAAR